MKVEYNTYILISTINPGTITLILNIAIVITAALYLNQDIIGIAGKFALFIFTGILIIFLIFGSLLLHGDKKYFAFESPDKSNTLVVEEDYLLLSGRCNFYERKDGIFIKSLKTQIVTADRPFTSNGYEISWIGDDTVKVSYYFTSGAKEYNEIVINVD